MFLSLEPVFCDDTRRDIKRNTNPRSHFPLIAGITENVPTSEPVSYDTRYYRKRYTTAKPIFYDDSKCIRKRNIVKFLAEIVRSFFHRFTMEKKHLMTFTQYAPVMADWNLYRLLTVDVFTVKICTCINLLRSRQLYYFNLLRSRQLVSAN